MVDHFTMRSHGVNQAFRFVEGIWLHRKSRQIRFFFGKRACFHHLCAMWNDQPSNIKTMCIAVMIAYLHGAEQGLYCKFPPPPSFVRYCIPHKFCQVQGWGRKLIPSMNFIKLCPNTQGRISGLSTVREEPLWPSRVMAGPPVTEPGPPAGPLLYHLESE